MTPAPRFSFFSSAVRFLSGRWAIALGEDRAVPLPAEARWALALNPGDLLPCEANSSGAGLRFHAYAWTVRSCVESVTHPWRYLEEILRRSMAFLGDQGELRLTAELCTELAAGPNDRIELTASVGAGQRWLALARASRSRRDEVWLNARYSLVVQPDLAVVLPDEVLWAFGLREGDRLTVEAKLDGLELLPAVAMARQLSLDPSVNSGAAVLGHDGLLPIPQRLAERFHFSPGEPLELTVKRLGDAYFRLALSPERLAPRVAS